MLRLLCFILLFCSNQVFAGFTAWVDMEINNGHISIPVEVSGIATRAILDTGSQTNAINRAFRNKNELEWGKGASVNIKGVYDTSRMSTFNQVPVTLFGSTFKFDGLVDMPLGHHSNGILLGATFLDNFILQIDYPNQRIRFALHESLNLSKSENIEFQLHKGRAMPIVKIGLGPEKSAWVLFDTGNNGGVLFNKSFAKSMKWADTLSEQQSMAVDATNHVAAMSTYRIPELQFGPYTLENVQVSVPSDDSRVNVLEQYSEVGSRIKGKRVQGILGYDVLQHFVVTIDYKNGHAHIGLPAEE